MGSIKKRFRDQAGDVAPGFGTGPLVREIEPGKAAPRDLRTRMVFMDMVKRICGVVEVNRAIFVMMMVDVLLVRELMHER